jgi:hypothetical protein
MFYTNQMTKQDVKINTNIQTNQCKPIKINTNMEKYMDELMNRKRENDEIIDEKFNSNSLGIINETVKDGNFYILDKYNLVIRKKYYNYSKSPYGWKYDEENDPVNIHIDPIMLKTKSPDITSITLQQLQITEKGGVSGKRGCHHFF